MLLISDFYLSWCDIEVTHCMSYMDIYMSCVYFVREVTTKRVAKLFIAPPNQHLASLFSGAHLVFCRWVQETGSSVSTYMYISLVLVYIIFRQLSIQTYRNKKLYVAIQKQLLIKVHAFPHLNNLFADGPIKCQYITRRHNDDWKVYWQDLPDLF